MRLALDYVRQSDQGRLIALTSISAKHPLENSVFKQYHTHGVVKALSREMVAEGITVNVVCPGYTRTERLAARQSGKRREPVWWLTIYMASGLPLSPWADWESPGVGRCRGISLQQTGRIHCGAQFAGRRRL